MIHSYVGRLTICIPRDFPREFKYYRIIALKYVCEHFGLADGEYRAMRASLLLGAWIIHHFNALQRRPQSTESHAEMLACVSAWEPIDWDDPEEGKYPILYGRGVFYASDIVMTDQCWRLPVTRLPSADDIANYYNVSDFDTLVATFTGGLVQAPADAHRRVRNRARHMIDVVHLRSQNIRDDESIPNLNLQDRGIELRPRPEPRGIDVDNHQEALDEDITNEMDEQNANDPDALCSRMLANFAYNIFQRSPNKKPINESAYVLIKPSRYPTLTCEIFKSIDLSRVFFSVFARECTVEAWNIIFDRYYPPHAFVLPTRGVQNWPALPYYQQWAAIRARLDANDVEVVRRAIKREFDEFIWVPHSYTDRVWCTKSSGLNPRNWKRYPPRPHNLAAPHIALNPRFRHLWSNIRVGLPPTATANPNDSNDDDDPEERVAEGSRRRAHPRREMDRENQYEERDEGEEIEGGRSRQSSVARRPEMIPYERQPSEIEGGHSRESSVARRPGMIPYERQPSELRRRCVRSYDSATT